MQGADSSVLLKKILLPEIDLDDKDDISECSLSDCQLSQSVLPKKPTLVEVVIEFVGKAVVIVIIDGELSPASFFLLKAPDYSKSTLLDLTEIRKRGQLA